jgi:predicted AAA+ superfamily ATPase
VNYFANFLYKTVKNYCVDNGIRNGENGFKNTNTGYQLENIVFLELLRRGYDVSEGRMRNGQIDFIASKNIETLFIQVTEKID